MKQLNQSKRQNTGVYGCYLKQFIEICYENREVKMIRLIVIESIIVLLLNVPFGYWRFNVRKLSIHWILAVHIPVLFVVALRLCTNIGFSWYSYVLLVTAFFLGQKMGSIVHKYVSKTCAETSSCLVMDIIRCAKHH
jgi:hypothetical protein